MSTKPEYDFRSIHGDSSGPVGVRYHARQVETAQRFLGPGRPLMSGCYISLRCGMRVGNEGCLLRGAANAKITFHRTGAM